MALRFADILTSASSVADYLGDMEVRPAHVLRALALLRDEGTMSDLGPGLSPLVPRAPGAGAVAPELANLVQKWFARLGRDATAELGEADLEAFEADLQELDESSG